MPSTIRYRWGDVVLVAFPLSYMSGAIRRPGLVLFDSGDEDAMLARITTQPMRGPMDVRIADWKAAGLIAQSVIRLSKVATIRKSLVDRRLGALSPKDKKLCGWFRLECSLSHDEAHNRHRYDNAFQLVRGDAPSRTCNLLLDGCTHLE